MEQLTGLSPLLGIEFLSAAVVFVILFFIRAPYGRFARAGWGPALSAKWGWFLMELPAAGVILAVFIGNPSRATAPIAIVFLLCWELHYVYRCLIYPFLKRGGDKRFPVLLVAFALFFNSINGYLNGVMLTENPLLKGWDYLSDPRLICGGILFFAGFSCHVLSDRYLRTLRTGTSDNYVIPVRGMFKLVSNPHYLGEILQWCGWALASWSLAGVGFAVFTVANLVPRAWSHHRWYHRTFAGYPASRKALLPFIW